MNFSQHFTLIISAIGVFLGSDFAWGKAPNLAAPPSAGAAAAAPSEASTDFVRFVSTPQGDQLQTANVTYRDAQGHEVTLIGAIHIADPAYYHRLNTYFQEFDIVLYELVGGPYIPEIHDAAKVQQEEMKSSSPMAMQVLKRFYDFLQTKLHLGFQLDEIDYSAKNFLHADVTHEEFAKLQTEKRESFMGLWLKAMRASSGETSKNLPQIGLFQLLELLNRPGGEIELKRLLGQTFDEVEEIIGDIEKQGDTVILTERNRVLFSKLQSVLNRDLKRIGIFYGSAHFMDLEKRLREMGFTKVQQTWFTAWDLPPAPKEEAKPSSSATSPTFPR